MAPQQEEVPLNTDDQEASSEIELACEQEFQKYRKQFPSVQYMTSKELRQTSNETITLVDVRTKAEQKVSMLPDSISLHQWKAKELPKLEAAAAYGSNGKTQKKKVVFYCTIGYRSGVEAKKFQQAYPDLDIYSLDGIVPYTHTANADELPLVRDNQPTKQVHAFGKAWSKFANPDFEAVVFSKTKFLIEGVAVKFKQFFKKAK